MKRENSYSEIQVPVSITDLIKTFFANKRVVVLFGCLSISSCITFLQPLIIKRITDDGMLKGNIELIVMLSVALFLSFLLDSTINIIQTKNFSEIQNRMTISLYNLVLKKIYNLRKDFYNNHQDAEILYEITSDINSLAMIADQSILFTLSYCLTIIIGIIGLYLIYPKAVLIAVLAVPFKELLCIKMSKRNEESISKFMGVLQEFSAQFGDSVRGIREVKLWNLQSQKRKKLLKYQEDVLQERKNSVLYSCYQNVFGSLIDKIPVCLLYAYGGYLFVKGEVTIGGVSAFIAYTGNILNSIGALLSVRFLLSNIKPAIARLNSFLTSEEEDNITGDRKDIEPVRTLRIEHLQFDYPNRELLRDVNLELKTGQKAAVIGVNGSGKSSLVDLILKFEKPSSGKILLNNVDIADIPNDQYRNLLSVVDQEPYFFNDSIKNNVDPLMQKENQFIISQFEEYEMKAFVEERFQSDLDAKLHSAASVSGGERKRLALMRALLKDTPILIMDELTADYDFQGEEIVSEMLKTGFKNKIVIYITHNYSYLDIFDAVYELQNGELKKLEVEEIKRIMNI